MRINDLIREAVPPAKPLQILPQGVQTPPPPLTDKDVAPNKSSMSGKNPQLQTPSTAAPAATPAAAKPAPASPAPAVPYRVGMPGYDQAGKPLNAVGSAPKNIPPGDPAAFGGGVVNPPSKSGVVSKAELDNYRRDSGKVWTAVAGLCL